MAQLAAGLYEQQSVLVLAYGRHPVQGTLVMHDTQTLSSTGEKQVTILQALGEGEWDACEQLYYAGEPLDANFVHFHPGTLSTGTGDALQGVDSFFPSGITYNGVAYVAVRLPAGMADENDPTRLKGVFRCLKVSDYDSAGNVTGYSWSANPARVAADLIIKRAGRPASRIDWPSWVAWRDYCDQTISWNDGTSTRTIKRFEANVFFGAPVSLDDALDLLCLLSCSDWQDVDGRLKFMTPQARASVHSFTLSNIKEGSFSAYEKDRRERPTRWKASYRNHDDTYLSPADPVEAVRPDLYEALGQENEFYPLELGGMLKSQAERVLNYQMRLKSDLPVFCELTGLGDSAHVAPGDVVAVTHDVQGWAAKPFIVVSATDECIETTADERTFVLQEYNSAAYSDADQSPLQRASTAPQTENPFAAPPAVSSLSLAESSRLLPDGTRVPTIQGTATFGLFAAQQRGRVWWWKAGASGYVATDTVIIPEPSARTASFELIGVEAGLHKIKVVPESPLGVSLAFTSHVEYLITTTGPQVAPSAPASLTGAFDGQRVVWTWPASVSPDVAFYRIADGGGTALQARVDATTWAEYPAAASLTRRVYAVSHTGLASGGYATAAATVPAPTAPTGYALAFDGAAAGQQSYLNHRWTPVEGVTYELYDAGETTLIWRGSGGAYDEPITATPSRSYTRKLRPLRLGIYNSFTSASVSVAAPTAPALAKGLETSYSLVVRITNGLTNAEKGQIKATVFELATDSGFASIVSTEKRPEYRSEVTLFGAPGQTYYVRARYETIFSDDSANSPPLTHQFKTIGDSNGLLGNLYFEPDGAYDIGVKPAGYTFARPRAVHIKNYLGVYGNTYIMPQAAASAGLVVISPETYNASAKLFWVLSSALARAGDVFTCYYDRAEFGAPLTVKDLTHVQDVRFRADNAYDIGQSGAARPRDLYLARNLAVAGAGDFGDHVGLGYGKFIRYAGNNVVGFNSGYQVEFGNNSYNSVVRAAGTIYFYAGATLPMTMDSTNGITVYGQMTLQNTLTGYTFHAKPTGVGGCAITFGHAAAHGYLAWYRPDGTRAAYFGYGDSNTSGSRYLELVYEGVDWVQFPGWRFKSSGHLHASGDNAYDIGASGAGRPRNVYVGTDLVVARSLAVEGGGTGVGSTFGGAVSCGGASFVNIGAAWGNSAGTRGLTIFAEFAPFTGEFLRLSNHLAQPVARFVGDGQLVVGNITPAGGESIEAAGNVRTRGEFVQYQASCGGELRVKKFEELVTLAAAAYTDTAATVPGDAIILAVSGRVVAADGDGNVSSFSIGQAGDATAFDSGVLNIAGVTFKGTDSGPLASPNNRAVRITPSVAPASGARGQIRVVVYYVAVTPPAF
jgi:hypothetical protein